MDLIADLPSTPTLDAQRDVELGLLHFLKKYNPTTYALWRTHPLLESEGHVLRGEDDECLDEDDEDAGPEERVLSWTRRHAAPDFNSSIPLLRRFHVEYLKRQLGVLSPAVQSLYSSRSWLAYWSLQASDLLGVTSVLLEEVAAEGLVELIFSCLVPLALSDFRGCDPNGNRRVPDPEDSPPSFTCSSSSSPSASPSAAGSASERREKLKKPIIGFAGGPSTQVAHVISAYPAICALCLLHSYHPCLHLLPRAALKRWLLALRTKDGGFCVHPGGEYDIRVSYTVAVIVNLLRLDEPDTFGDGLTAELEDAEVGGSSSKSNSCSAIYARLGITRENGYDLSSYEDIRHTPVITAQTARFVAAQQTVEGGFACAPNASEPHGAYTQCGLAALLLMGQPQLVHQPRLRRWLAARQLSFEGGFNGRTNKLVDSCYSHWVGSSHVLLKVIESHCRLLGSDLNTRARRYEQHRLRHRQHENEEGDGCVSPTSTYSAGTSDAGRGGGEEEEGRAQGHFLLAKELFLLDHAQLLDLKLACCSDNDAWDRAETEELQKNDLLEQFMSADDSALWEAVRHRDEAYDLYGQLHRQECLEGKNLPWTDENIANELQNIKADAAFANAPVGDYYFNQQKLQQYVLRCCQCWQDGEGGLMDKPECNNDAYHTCYSLTGMSSAQNLQYAAHAGSTAESSPYVHRAMEVKGYVPGKKENYGVVVGVEGPSVGAEVTVLRTTNPMVNLHRSRVVKAMSTWGTKMFF